MVSKVEAIYAKASTSLALIQTASICNKLKAKYEKAVLLNRSATSTNKRNQFARELDSLFEVLECKCPMLKENDDPVRIECKCSLAKKIPVTELEFIFAQRYRKEKAPTLQIGRLDIPATKKLTKKQAKKLREKQLIEEHAVKTTRETQEEKTSRQEQLAEYLASQESDSREESRARVDPDVSFDVKGEKYVFC